MNVVGKPIIDEICREIEYYDLFLCDLTFTNLNVLFELGYAIINSKQIWISLDQSISDKNSLYTELNLLTTIGNATYTKAENLVANFNVYWNSSDKDNYYEKYIKTVARELDREPNIVTRQLKKSFNLVVDDPQEVRIRNIEWYIDNVYSSYTVVAHFLDKTRNEKYKQNAKYALICGMAYGVGRGPLMLAHSPYLPEIDFRHLMEVHKSPTQTISFMNSWVSENEVKYSNFVDAYKARKKNKPVRSLKHINLGEYVAEDEQNSLPNYFIDTAVYQDAFNVSQYMIYVGRKGAGKTANFLKLAEDLEKQYKRDTHVCKIKPVGYELAGVLRIFDANIPEDTKHHVIENLWKYLIYSELTLDLYKKISTKNSANMSDKEQEFLKFVYQHEFLRDDFTVRMENLLNQIISIESHESDTSQREFISQVLHEKVLSNLRAMLGDLLGTKDKVYILIDNLDKAWQRHPQIDKLSRFLFALLNVVENIVLEFQKGSSKQISVDLVLLLFLRSDIFSHVMPNINERDKLRFTVINWRDKEVLQRLIEQRFLSGANDKHLNGYEVWEKYFIDKIEGQPTKDYIISRILPKPRDAIFICKQAMRHALNRGHSKIQAEDIKSAERDYSQQSWFTLLAETQAQFGDIEAFLIEFVGSNSIVTHQEILELAEVANLIDIDMNNILNVLFEFNFLGIETSDGVFEYLYDDNRKKVLEKMAEKLHIKNGYKRYEINHPFHIHLGIQQNGKR